MLKVTKISKTYTKGKHIITNALQEISLEFPNTGFVCIVGKSGSGKTTLMNVLGGLDTANSGKIIFQGTSINSYSQKELDLFRNTCIGFIFQSYNLLEDFTVRDNVLLALDLQHQNNNKEERLTNALNTVGILDLKDRLAKDLSGGEKQRVAIARALVKDSVILLADEPTGNLDTENSIQILDYLKLASKEKLVIMVTHNLEYANRYADRIIELKKGVVNKDSENESKSNIKFDWALPKKKLRLPLRTTFKMAKLNLSFKKIRTIVSIFIASFALFLFGMSQIVSHYDRNASSLETFKDHDVSILPINRCDSSSIVEGQCDLQTLSDADIEHLTSLDAALPLDRIYNMPLSIPNEFKRIINEPVTTDQSDTFTPAYLSGVVIVDEFIPYPYLIGTLGDDDFDIVLTDYMYDHLFPSTSISLITDGLVTLTINEQIYTITGILDTNYQQYTALANKSDNRNDTSYEEEHALYLEFKQVQSDLLSRIYVKYSCFANLLAYQSLYFQVSNDTLSEMELFTITSKTNDYYYLESDKELPEGDGIFLDLESFNLIYNTNFTPGSVIEGNFDLTAYSDQTRELILSRFNYELGNLVVTTVTIHVDGIYYDPSLYDSGAAFEQVPSMNPLIVFSSEKLQAILISENGYSKTLVQLSDSNQVNLSFLSEIEDNYRHNSYLSDMLYQTEYVASKVSAVSISISIALGLISFLFLSNLFTQMISRYTYQIGVLRSVGTSRFSLVGLYGIQMLLLSLAYYGLSVLWLLLAIPKLNQSIISGTGYQVVLFTYQSSSTIAMLFLALFVSIVSLILPFIRIWNMKPIDIIDS
ncbi:MAG: ABC transporter ATP-binding protein/permease [Candidatus Izemoplasmatales bacterium]|nr:ABC transporter ATP-binding protein/permease [Candidatus Izemoplasmatales bacterium]